MSNKRKLRRGRAPKTHSDIPMPSAVKLSAPKPEQHLCVCVPAYGLSPAEFWVSFIDLVKYMSDHGVSFDIKIANQAYVDYARNDLIKRAYADGATEILFLDHDMVFPPNLYHRLKAHAVPVVAALYFKRLAPYDPLIFDWVDGPESDRIDTFPRYDYEVGLQKCGAVGMGATLIQFEAIEKVVQWQIDQGDTNPAPFRVFPPIGEDIWFCKHAHKAGVDVYCDTSLVLKHMGLNPVDDSYFRLAARYGSLRGALDRLEQVDGRARFTRGGADGQAHLGAAVAEPVGDGVPAGARQAP